MGCGHRARNKISFQSAHMAGLDGAWEELFLIAFPFFYSYVILLAMLLGLHLDSPASALQSNIPFYTSSYCCSLPTTCHCYIKTALLIIMKNLRLKKNVSINLNSVSKSNCRIIRFLKFLLHYTFLIHFLLFLFLSLGITNQNLTKPRFLKLMLT